MIWGLYIVIIVAINCQRVYIIIRKQNKTNSGKNVYSQELIKNHLLVHLHICSHGNYFILFYLKNTIILVSYFTSWIFYNSFTKVFKLSTTNNRFFFFQAELDQDTYIQLRLQHALNDDPVPNYVDRGNISMSSIRNGNPTVGQIGLTSSQIKQLKALAQNNGAYKLKAIVRSSSGNEVTLYTSTPAVITIIIIISQHNLPKVIYSI